MSIGLKCWTGRPRTCSCCSMSATGPEKNSPGNTDNRCRKLLKRHHWRPNHRQAVPAQQSVAVQFHQPTDHTALLDRKPAPPPSAADSTHLLFRDMTMTITKRLILTLS